MATTNLQLFGSNSRQIKPAVVNLFANNNNVDKLEFVMENYNQGNVDLSALDPYAICYGEKFLNGLDEVKLTSEVTDDGMLRIYWDLTLMTLTDAQTITYQIVFKNSEGAVWSSYKAILFCNESLTADEEIVAQYPTILKQMEGRIETKTDEAVEGAVTEITTNVSTHVNNAITEINQTTNNTITHVNQMAESFDASVVYIPFGETIPVEQRVSNRLYYQYTNESHSMGRFEDSKGTVLIVDESGSSVYTPIGAIIAVNAASNYVPVGSLPCNGVEYVNGMFMDFWNNWLYTGFEIKSQYEGLIGYESSGRPSVEIAEMRFNTDCDHVTIDEGIDWSLCFNLYDVTTSQKLCSVYNSGMSSWVDVVVEGGELKMTLLGSLSSIETVSTGNLYVKREDEMIWYSLNGSEWEGVFSVGSGASQFGSEDLRGYVNLFESYINGVQLAVERSVGLLNTCTYAEYEQDLATYGQCGKFAVDLDRKTFRVPLIKDGSVIQQALTNDELGKAYNAGLPNITGTFAYSCNEGATPAVSGVFTRTTVSKDTNNGAGYQGDGTSNNYTMKVDASLSNPIYGNSDTVQPNAVAMRYFVIVANGQLNQSMMDWNEWATSLQTKVNVNDMVDAGSYIAGCAMPSNKYISLTLGSSGATYTAPANGWFIVNRRAGAAGQYVNIFHENLGIYWGGSAVAYAAYDECGRVCPVKKGDVVKIHHTAAGNIDLFVFVYAQGSESEAQ